MGLPTTFEYQIAPDAQPFHIERLRRRDVTYALAASLLDIKGRALEEQMNTSAGMPYEPGAVYACFNPAGSEEPYVTHLKSGMFYRNLACWVVRDVAGGPIRGYAEVHFKAASTFLANIMVEPGGAIPLGAISDDVSLRQGKGAGTALLHAALKAAPWTTPPVTLTTWPENPAVSWYERLGFAHTAYVKSVPIDTRAVQLHAYTSVGSLSSVLGRIEERHPGIQSRPL